MKKLLELTLRPEEIDLPSILQIKASQTLSLPLEKISAVIPLKRSIDARSKYPIFRFFIDVYIDENPLDSNDKIDYRPVGSDKKVIIIGFGPAGMFAALKLIEAGIKPIIVERGKDVRARRRDIKALQQDQIVNPESNYCFGEGGAGAYSDGKLYTRSTKRGDTKRILDILIQHGADSEIKIDTHPHIGSNKLPKIVTAIRETIINCGGEILYNSRVTDFLLKDDKIIGVNVNNQLDLIGDAVILATGHSARDIFYLLHKKNILIEPKPFAMGVRIEHPQSLIDEIQYHTKLKPANLPAANYSLSCNIDGRGVYSFCMCPGGIIVPSATAQEEIVVNGMSVSKRNSPFANSGFVVEITEKDWMEFDNFHPFAGIKLQMKLEKNAYELADHTQKAPAQRVTDFIEGKYSQTLPKSSYIPGLTSAELHKELPEFISSRLKKALLLFNKKKRGYYTDEAIVVGVESRTSSPIRIPRNKETLMHMQIKGLFPCGEGAGYAGGIVSAAIDGENVAGAIVKYLS